MSWEDQLGLRQLLYPPQKSQISPLKTIPDLCPHLLVACSPALTWRDLQHLIIRASKPAHLQAEDWAENGVGRRGECRAQPLKPLPAAPPRCPGGTEGLTGPSLGWHPCPSEPLLRLRAAGRGAAGAGGHDVGTDSASGEVFGPGRSGPQVRDSDPRSGLAVPTTGTGTQKVICAAQRPRRRAGRASPPACP